MLLKKRVAKILRELADKIDAGNSELAEPEAMEIMSVLCHESLSKAQACIYLHNKRAQFDKLVKEGKLPKGKKITGYKELRWYKDELDACIKNKNYK